MMNAPMQITSCCRTLLGLCTVSPKSFNAATKSTSQGAKERVQGTHSSYDWGGSLKASG